MFPIALSVRPQPLSSLAVMLAAAFFATAGRGDASAGSCSSCSGSDRDEVSFRASADLQPGGSVSITLGNTAANGRTMTAANTLSTSATLSTGTGTVPTPREMLLDGSLTIYKSTGDGCNNAGLISADFVPSGGCGVTYQIRTRGPSQDPSSDNWEGWSSNLHPLWMYIGPPTETLVIQFQIRILRTDGGTPSAPRAVTEMTPPTVEGNSSGTQTVPAAFSSRIPMGATAGTGRYNAGSLVLAGPLSTALASRGNMVLRSPIDIAPFDAGSPDLLHAINDSLSGNILRQVKSGTRLMDLGDVDENNPAVGFRVRVYEAGDYSNTLTGGLYPINPEVEPSVTYTYRKVAAASGNLGGLRVDTLHRDGTTETQTYLNTTTSEYTITSGDGLETVTVLSVVEQVSNVWHRTDLETVHRDGALYAKTSREFVFQTVSHSANTGLSVIPFMIEEDRYVTDNGGPLVTSYSESDHPGLPAVITRPDGGWEKRTYYDGSGTDGGQPAWLRLPKQIISPWNGSPETPPGNGTSGCQVVTLGYTAVDGVLQAAGRTTTMPPSERILLSATGDLSSLVDLLGDAGLAAAWQPTASDVATVTQADLVGQNEQIPTTSIRYRTEPVLGLPTPPVGQADYALVPWAGRTFATLDAEGDGTVTGYEPGTFNTTTGAFTMVSPANLATATHLRAITLDLRNTDLPVIEERVKRVTIEDLAGRVVREEMYLHDGSSWPAPTTPAVPTAATVSTITYDDAPADALRSVTYEQDGRTTREVIEVSPFETVTIDGQGITTTTLTDALGRVTSVVVEGCGGQPDRTTTTSYQGRSASTTHSAGGLSLTSLETRDLLGRTTSRTDPSGAVVSTTYPNGGRDTAVTFPGNNNLVTTRTIDGLNASVTGTAAVNEYWSYAISGDNLIATRQLGASNSGRSVTTATDAAGRQVSVTSPSPADDSSTVIVTTGYAPGTRRSTSRTTEAGNTAPLLFDRPEPSSSLEHSGLDANASGTLTLNSRDRITATRSYYAKVSNLWWRVTESKTYDTNANDQSAIVTTVRERLSGNDEGLASVTISTLPGGGTVTSSVAIDRANKTRTASSWQTGCTLPETTVNLNGLDVSQTTHQSATPTVRRFDALGRIFTETTPLGAMTKTLWDSMGRVHSVTDHFNHTTYYTWYGSDTIAAGRLWQETNPLGKTTESTWSARGELLTTSGDATYPVTYTYDDYGDLETQTTWRGTATSPVAETTTWQRATNSGVLLTRINADATATAHTWYANGRPHTCERESGATTTWVWNAVGDLTAINYSGDGDRTPDVSITAHTRLGQPAAITQSGIGSETRSYHPGTGAPASHTYASDHNLLPDKSITWGELDAYGRPTGFAPSGGPAVTYGWNALGLLETVANGSVTHTYTYRPDTDWIQSVATPDFRQTNSRDIGGRQLAAASHALNGQTATPLTRHGYTFDALDRRVSSTLLDGSTWQWDRNDRGEITTAVRKQPGGTEVAALGATYSYDEIGNRITSTSPLLGNLGYTVNAVNQYTAILSNDTRTVLGTAPTDPTITVNGTSAARQGNLFTALLTGDNDDEEPDWLQAVVSDGTTTQTRHAWLPKASTTITHDPDGNLTIDGQWSYLWDAENRLVSMETTPDAVTAGRPYRKLTFAYDWTGRRLARDIYGPNNTLLTATRWLNDGWNPVAEYSDQTTGQTLVRTYLWGLDITGSLTDTGGVGALLAMTIHDPQSTIFYPSYDGNGNIVAWTQPGATAPVCLREYDSFGNIVVEHGAPPCNFGFSTKQEDPETGLLYYGYRYLSPPMGRWLSADPIEERGGINLYGFVGNNGVGKWDRRGLSSYPGAQGGCRCCVSEPLRVEKSGNNTGVGVSFFLSAGFSSIGDCNPNCCELRQMIRGRVTFKYTRGDGEVVTDSTKTPPTGRFFDAELKEDQWTEEPYNRENCPADYHTMPDGSQRVRHYDSPGLSFPVGPGQSLELSMDFVAYVVDTCRNISLLPPRSYGFKARDNEVYDEYGFDGESEARGDSFTLGGSPLGSRNLTMNEIVERGAMMNRDLEERRERERERTRPPSSRIHPKLPPPPRPR